MEEPSEITVSELKRLMDSGAHINLIDVREPHEYDLCHLDGSRLMSLGQIPKQLKDFSPTEEYVFYCHVGDRSAWVVNYLRHIGFRKVKNLIGGIDRWAAEDDDSMPRY